MTWKQSRPPYFYLFHLNGSLMQNTSHKGPVQLLELTRCRRTRAVSHYITRLIHSTRKISRSLRCSAHHILKEASAS